MHLAARPLASRPRRLPLPCRALAQQKTQRAYCGAQACRRCKTAGAKPSGGHVLTRGKVVLFYPAYDGPPLGAPLCLLALASTLREANFEVVLIDAAIDPDYRT